MSYQNYVAAAYAVFFVVLLWDLAVPRIQIRQQLRAARLRAARMSTNKNGLAPASPESLDRHSGESRNPL